MTREEFIGKAADAILRAGGFDPDRADLGLMRLPAPSTSMTMERLANVERLKAVEKATAALDAVGAWELRIAVDILWAPEIRKFVDGSLSEPGSRYYRVAELLGTPEIPEGRQ